MKNQSLLKILALMVLALAVGLVGCEGDEGPAGPAGPEGPEGPEGPQGPPGEGAEISEYAYVGGAGDVCAHCHASVVEDMSHTGHADAYDMGDPAALENPYCLQCHTTGWDRPASYGSDDWMTADNPDTSGFDDYFGQTDAVSVERMALLEGVQCESCHGPMGPEFDHAPLLSFATMDTHDPENITAADITSPCYPCHSTQFEGPDHDFTGGYATSGHASVAGGDLDALNAEHYAHVGSCQPCHTSEGFIAANDPAFADYSFGHTVNFIGCVTCHDPHVGEEGAEHSAQLRNVGPATLAYSYPYEPDDAEAPTMDGYENGQLCAQCHKARRDNANVAGQIANGYAHFGPHHSAQADMFIGYGSYEIPGYDYDDGRTHLHQNVTQACVDCHMVRETELHGETQDYAFHNFVPEISTNCAGCHGASFTETDVDDYQATIVALMDELAVDFGYTDYHDMEENWDSTAEGVQEWERESAYAMFFIIGDGSLGVHNPMYAEELLNNAIDYYNDKK